MRRTRPAGLARCRRSLANTLRSAASFFSYQAIAGGAVTCCCRRQWLRLTRWLVGLGAPVESADALGLRPIDYAVHGGHEELTELLIQRCASVSAAKDRWSPLALAASSGQPGLVRALLSAGASPTELDGAGLSPVDWSLVKYVTARQLQQAEEADRILDCLALLLAHTADGGSSPLGARMAFAAAYGDQELVQCLLTSGH